jgi:hypothetical protein
MVSISQLMLLHTTTALKHKYMENSQQAALHVAQLPAHHFGTQPTLKGAVLQNQWHYSQLKAQEMILAEHRILQDMKLEYTLERLRHATPSVLNVLA